MGGPFVCGCVCPCVCVCVVYAFRVAFAIAFYAVDCSKCAAYVAQTRNLSSAELQARSTVDSAPGWIIDYQIPR